MSPASATMLTKTPNTSSTRERMNMDVKVSKNRRRSEVFFNFPFPLLRRTSVFILDFVISLPSYPRMDKKQQKKLYKANIIVAN
jgi:hypothetical protein